MYRELKKRRNWLPLLLMLFLTILIEGTNVSFLHSASINTQTQFVLSEIFSMEWGNNTSQAGLLKVPGGNYGPQSFSVDEKDSKIYILDSTNQRILVFDARGNLLSFILISERADDLCLGNKENVYVLYNSEMKVVEYSFDGSVLRTIPVTNTALPIMGIYFSSGQGLYCETSEEISFPLIISPEAQIEEKITGLIRNHNRFLLEVEDGQGIIKTLDYRGNVKKQTPVLKDDQKIETLSLIGIDGRKNIYLAVEVSTNSFEIKRYLRKYNQDGCLIAESTIPYSNYVYTFKDLRVTRSGKVYQILSLKEHVKVLMWTLDNTGLKPGDEFIDQIFSYTFPRPEDFLPGDQKNTDTQELEVEKEKYSFYAASISRNNIISRAESYANRYFYVGSSNITSGYYCSGKTVITPVTSSGWYTGVLYKWGGFTGLTGVTSYTDCGNIFYNEGLSAGKYAGDKDTTTTFGVCCPVGVDCSGYVSQTWGLTSKESTGTLPTISVKLPSNDYLTKGDILDNIGIAHVRLFINKENDGRFTIYESSARDWKVSKYSYYAYQLSGYDPYRYNKLSDAFQVGDRVEATANCNIRSCASTTCNIICTASTGNKGTVVGGSQEADGYVWWQISWDNGTGNCSNGTTGWSVANYLVRTSGGGTAQITVTTNPTGLLITVDGTSYTSPQTFSWSNGSQHTIATPSPQYSADQKTRYNYASWSDGGAQSHTITVSSNATYTATFSTQYLLDTFVNPVGSGRITLSPSGPWYNSNQSVQLTATANSGYTFKNWGGDLSGSSNPATLNMNGPKSVTANFEIVPPHNVTATINSISPNPAAQGTTVNFSGTGSDSSGHSITAYSWRSSIDGTIGTSASFGKNNLSVGSHNIYFKVQCSNGDWSSEISWSGNPLVITPPLIVTFFQINNGAAETTSRKVKLNNMATGSPTHYSASESESSTFTKWKKYATAPPFELRPGVGEKTVYFKVKNAKGESSVVQDSIKLKKKK